MRPEPGETLGLVIAVTFLAGFVVIALVIGTGHLGDVAVFVLGRELAGTLLTGAAVAGVLGLLGWAGIRGAGHVGAHGHVHRVADGSNRGRELLQRHEDAHQRVCARVGGGGSTIRIWPENGGWSGTTTFHDPRRVGALPPEKKIAIDLAGLIAAPGTTSPTDEPHAEQHAREADDPSQAMREGRKIARRYV